MVQYVFTPWSNQAELLAVRAQIYPEKTAALIEESNTNRKSSLPPPPPQPPATTTTMTATTTTTQDTGANDESDGYNNEADERRKKEQRRIIRGEKLDALWKVSTWAHRGNCPHLVESTGLLMDAVLLDESVRENGGRGGPFVVGMAYAMAYTRFVTGLVDSYQAAAKKMAMTMVARIIDLPTSFVELRHQITHETMPPVHALRMGVEKALEWIWDRYWSRLKMPPPSSPPSSYPASSFDSGFTAAGARKMVGKESTKEILALLSLPADEGEDEARVWNMRWQDQNHIVCLRKKYGDKAIMRVLNGGSDGKGGAMTKAVKARAQVLAGELAEVVVKEQQEREGGGRMDLRRKMEVLRTVLGVGVEEGDGDVDMGEGDGGGDDGDMDIPAEGLELGFWEFQGEWTPRPIGV